MQRGVYPILTTTDNISAFDLNNRFRVQLWDSSPEAIKWDQRENDAILLTLLEYVDKRNNVWTNPIMRWSEDTRLDGWTTLASNMTAAGADLTYINVVDPLVCNGKWSGLSIPITGENLLVVEIDPDYSEGWVTTAGGPANVKVDRTKFGTAQVAANAGAYVYVMPPYMGELGEPRVGTTTTPGEPMYNYISLISSSFSMSKYQLGSKMLGGFGELPKEVQNTVFKIRQQQQYGLLFQNRTTWMDATEKQVYIGNGLLHYMKTNVLDLGNLGNRFTWENFNDFLDPTFDPYESGDSKILIAGPNLYADGLRMMRELERLDAAPYFEPTMRSWTYNIKTDMGRNVTVYLDKYALGGGLSKWGFLIDPKNLSGGEYQGLGAQWIQNIQSTRSVLQREDAYLMSYALNVFHERCHGVIRGGTAPIVVR